MNDYIVYYKYKYTCVTASLYLLQKKFPFAVIRKADEVDDDISDDTTMILHDSTYVPYPDFLSLYYA